MAIKAKPTSDSARFEKTRAAFPDVKAADGMFDWATAGLVLL
ncbi:MAG: hypothetical protein ACRD1Y_02415 [Terriglobales bacterium]